MVIGCLGDIVFQVSERTVETLNNMEWSGSARYAVHERHGTDALTEFVGRDPDQITFDITLSAELGVHPLTEMVKLWGINRSGRAVPLVVGTKIYGKYRWNITKLAMKIPAHFPNGDIHTATVSVSLQEYVRGERMRYTVSAADLGGAASGEGETVRSVLENIAAILATPKGSVPLYRDFGLDMSFVDRPPEVVRTLMIAPVKEAVERWEPRATVLDVSFSGDPAQPGRLIPTVEVEIDLE